MNLTRNGSFVSFPFMTITCVKITLKLINGYLVLLYDGRTFKEVQKCLVFLAYQNYPFFIYILVSY